jgi:hypothetical protein
MVVVFILVKVPDTFSEILRKNAHVLTLIITHPMHWSDEVARINSVDIGIVFLHNSLMKFAIILPKHADSLPNQPLSTSLFPCTRRSPAVFISIRLRS